MLTDLILGSIAAALFLKSRKKKQIDGIGRIKRRIWKEVSDAQNLGVDFGKKYSELDRYDLQYLKTVGMRYGWKQSKRSADSGKSYTESYYNSLRRAYNSITGVQGVGRSGDYDEWKVYNSNGKTALVYREYKDAIEHVESEVTDSATSEVAVPEDEFVEEAYHEPIPAQMYLADEVVEPATEKSLRKRAKKVDKELERQERAEFIENYVNPDEDRLKNHIINIGDRKGEHTLDVIKEEFVNNTLKVRAAKGRNKDPEIYLMGDWHSLSAHHSFYYYVTDMLEAWKDYQLNKRTEAADLDSIRIALLDKAKHMTLDLREEGIYPKDGNGFLIKGDERYDYLPYINYVAMCRMTIRNSNTGESIVTIYPMRAFNSKKVAEREMWKKSSGDANSTHTTSTITIVPIVDVNIEKIAGLSGFF